MSGFYSSWYKVNHPTSPNDITPMQSGGYQTPFFFGGSQVPVNLGLDTTVGSGVYKKAVMVPEIYGKGIQSTDYRKSTNIHLPRKIYM